jgi:hypothetical protein
MAAELEAKRKAGAAAIRLEEVMQKIASRDMNITFIIEFDHEGLCP